MVIKRSIMTSLLVPMTIKVIGHDIDMIKILIEKWNIITFINDLVAWRNSCREEKSLWFESCTQFLDKS